MFFNKSIDFIQNSSKNLINSSKNLINADSELILVVKNLNYYDFCTSLQNYHALSPIFLKQVSYRQAKDKGEDEEKS
jgi:hypothetical protein